jgi:DNA-binding beta-propeller fold protein YncE
LGRAAYASTRIGIFEYADTPLESVADPKFAVDSSTEQQGAPMRNLLATVIVILAGLTAAHAKQGWYPHEGALLKYRVNARFGLEPNTMPAGWVFGRVSAVSGDSQGNVYVLHRGEEADPVLAFDESGKFLRSWGRGMFGRRHGIRVDPDDNVWVLDYGDHQVFKFTPEGKLLMTLGEKGVPAEDETHFNRPADMAFTPDGDFYVADGYGNSRIAKFSKDGKFLFAWGKRGKGPGEFHIAHSVALGPDGTVYVADRSNNRIQVFDPNGKFLKQWTHHGATQGISFDRQGRMWILAARNHVENETLGGLSGRIMHIDAKSGEILGSIESPGHGLHAAANGHIYAASMSGNVLDWAPGWLAVSEDGGLRPE